jgi:hypothetical protein
MGGEAGRKHSHSFFQAKEELQIKQEELLELNRQLRSERMMSEEERARLIAEIEQRETQVSKMRNIVETKTHETNQLQASKQYSGHKI